MHCTALLLGTMKGGMSVGHRLKIWRYVWRRLPDETVSAMLKWFVECRVNKFEFRATF